MAPDASKAIIACTPLGRKLKYPDIINPLICQGVLTAWL